MRRDLERAMGRLERAMGRLVAEFAHRPIGSPEVHRPIGSPEGEQGEQA